MFVVLGVVAVIFLKVAGCLFGAQFYYASPSEVNLVQLEAARITSFHFAVGWGILFAVMLAMGAASRPFHDGRAAFLFSKPVPRSHVLLGQLLGVFLTALTTSAALAAVATALALIYFHVFLWTLWLALGVASLAIALAVVFVAFFSMFLPRVVAGLLGIVFYVANFPTTVRVIYEIMTGGFIDGVVGLPRYALWGAELKVYYALMPPVARVQLRAAELLGLGELRAELFGLEESGWSGDSWLTVATAAAYVVGLFVATWALYNRRDA
jgi:hypothetical protein